MKKGKAELSKPRGYWTRVANPKISLAGMDVPFAEDWHYFDKNGDELKDGDKVRVRLGMSHPSHWDFDGIFHIHERFYHAYIIWGMQSERLDAFKCPPNVWLENVVKMKGE